MKPPAYPSYKSIGVEWLSEVPEHWKFKRLKFSARTIMGQSPSSEFYTDDPNERPFLQGNAEFGTRFPRAKWFCDAAPKKVPEEALLLSVRAPVGALNEADLPYGIGRGLCAVIENDSGLEKDFGWYALHFYRTELDTKATGSTYAAVSADDVGNILLALPPSNEQEAIVDFLDRETGRIDRLIAKKHELNERLKEKRAALISRTVSRGLPPQAARAAGIAHQPQLKASGIDGIGDIPAHWEVVRIGRKIQLQRGVDITKDEQNDGSVPVVSSGGVSSFHDHALASGPGVVVGRKGTAGSVYYIETDFWPHDTTLWVKEFRGNFPRFVFYKLSAMDLSSFDTGSANPTVNRNLVHPVFVSWPPPAEQIFIANYLDRETSKIDRLVTTVEVAIERLQEYRTALITAAVTGKIDVRKAAA